MTLYMKEQSCWFNYMTDQLNELYKRLDALCLNEDTVKVSRQELQVLLHDLTQVIDAQVGNLKQLQELHKQKLKRYRKLLALGMDTSELFDD